MRLFVPSALARRVAFPLVEVIQRADRLGELRRLESSQYEPREATARRQRERLRRLLEHASQTCAHYTGYDPLLVADDGKFRTLPILSKSDLREKRDQLISSAFPREHLIAAKTGGSTGVSLEVFFGKRCQEHRNAAAMRADRWAGWEVGEPWGALWGNPPSVRSWREWVSHHFLERRVYLDTVDLTESRMRTFCKDLLANCIHHLFGHAHSLFVFARFLQEADIQGLDIRGIVSTSMMLLPNERATIERAFRCAVTDRYGCEELGLIACECQHHRGFHVNAEHVFVECLREDGTPTHPGEEGQLVITDLLNYAMPLIRYRVGDVGVLSERACPCGRSLPILERVVGRTADFLVRPDGSLVAGVSLVERTLTSIPGLEQLQIVQEVADRIVLNVVPDGAYSPEVEGLLREEARRAMGPGVACEIRLVDRLVQERNGKYRFAICHVKSRWQ